MRSKTLKSLLTVALFFSAIMIFTPIVSATDIYVPDNYVKIQWAVDNATTGDIIIVRDGTYTENVKVNKSLTIRSENGSAHTIVSAAKSNEDVIKVTEDYVNIAGFTIENATGSFKAGIYLGTGVDHCNVSDNYVSNNDYGILLYKSRDNTITNNIASSNNLDGIRLLYHSNNNTLTKNIANSNSETGILCWTSSDNILTYNNINLNAYGIWLHNSSSYNILANNSANSNEKYGICLSSSSKNTIYLNNFIDNVNNVYSTESTNGWNLPSKITYTYNGNTYTNYMGNYWSDYNGNDVDNDGIGDILYSIDSDKDIYLLVEPFENYFAPTEKPSISTPPHASLLTFEELMSAQERLDALYADFIELTERLEAYANRDASEIEGNYDSIRDELCDIRDDFLTLKGICLEFCKDNKEFCSKERAPDRYIFEKELFDQMIEDADAWYELEDYSRISDCFKKYIPDMTNTPRLPRIIQYDTKKDDPELDSYYRIDRFLNYEIWYEDIRIGDRIYNGECLYCDVLLLVPKDNSKDFCTLTVMKCNLYLYELFLELQKVKQVSDDPEIYLYKMSSCNSLACEYVHESVYFDVAIIGDGILICANDNPIEGPGEVVDYYNEISEVLMTDVDFSSLEAVN